MQAKDIMTQSVIPIAPDATADVAARTLTHYNIGALPVCDSRGRLQGMVTDRDLVIRCMAQNRLPQQTRVGDIMTRQVVSVVPETAVEEVSRIMGSHQIRRLPVTRNGVLQGMISLADLTTLEDTAAQVLTNISANTSHR